MRKATVKTSGKITVRVANESDPTENLSLPKGSTVQDAIDKCDISLNGRNLHVDGQLAEAGDELQEGDIIVVTGKKEGNADDEETSDEEENEETEETPEEKENEEESEEESNKD